jgi:xanthine dehydrogenase accessory factor
MQDYPLGPLLAQCCGGRVRLLIERLDKTAVDWLTDAARRLDAAQPFEVRTRFDPGAADQDDRAGRGVQARRRADHPGGRPGTARGARPALGDVLVEPQDLPASAGAAVRGRPCRPGRGPGLRAAAVPSAWYDTRPETADIPGVTVGSSRRAGRRRDGRGADAYVLIMTHDHDLDYALTSSALAGGAFGYLGLIGSDTKQARFLSRLREDGFGDGTVPASPARSACRT